MIKLITEALKNIHDVLGNWDEWKTLYVDYAPPTVERAWIPYKTDYRLCIHRIHPCDPALALYHPHPWPSAVFMCDGEYEMITGYGDPKGPPPPVSHRFIVKPGTRYEMVDPNAWHAVIPTKKPSISLMLMGPLYKTEEKREKKQLRELTKQEFLFLHEFFWQNSITRLL